MAGGIQAWQNGRPLAVKAVTVSGGATPEDATGGYFVTRLCSRTGRP